MPQLNPSPWFAILVFSWFIFLTVVPPKILEHNFPNELTAHMKEMPEIEPWNWPWF